jgi:hypothetical protein
MTRKRRANSSEPSRSLVCPFTASREHKAAAKTVADALGVKIITEGKTNPVCCVWLEVTKWTPSPGEPGYVIINQGGGSLISASDEKQLQAAVARFIASIDKSKKEARVPRGLMTSYPIAKEKAADAPSKR